MIQILVDANVLPLVFKSNPEGIYEFIYKSLTSKKTILVRGGSKYDLELSKLASVVKLINLYKDNKTISVLSLDKITVDSCAVKIKDGCQTKDFDDEHLLAIICLSKVKVVCSNDCRADRYITDKTLYPLKIEIPKICRDISHKHLLGY